ncbi:MAG: 4Fe-4S binding protein [Deltaproteobacteria bacterium]|jgi:polyferredoxin|nr:4Fe-4S binding protein [Deltaproteobacteria bacterium]
MLLKVYRLIVQHLSFIILIYGGRFGVQLGPAVPCFACPYVNGCGGQCYLMGLQGYIGFGISLADFWGFEGLRALFYLAVFIILVVLLGKIWCGWICPFGLFQDWLTYLRRKLGFSSLKIEPETLHKLGYVKYILLGWLILGPILVDLKVLHPDFYLPFCQMFCPAKPILPVFGGEFRHFALDTTNLVTRIVTTSSLLVTGGFLAAMFARPRFFCTFCPLLAMIHFLEPLTLLKLKKEPLLCHGCGTCQRVCNMDVEEVCLEKEKKDVQVVDCINCGDCIASCSAKGALGFSFAGKTLVSSSRELSLGLKTKKTSA